MEERGDTVLVVNGKSTTFRFKISVPMVDYLEIWLEDRESKAQWCTKQLLLNDFVTAENKLTKATVFDYATQFAGCLRSRDQKMKLISPPTAHGARKLELQLPFAAVSFSATLVYYVELEPIASDRVDVLEAQLQDLKEEVAQLRAAVAGRSGFGRPTGFSFGTLSP